MVHGELGELLERSVELGAIRAGAEAVAAGEGRDRGRCESGRVVAGHKPDSKPAS